MKTTYDSFNQDALNKGGYVYASDEKLSCCVSNHRQTDSILKIIDFHNKKVIDFGCGDGVFTTQLFDLGKPVSIVGIDLAVEAIKVAQAKVGERDITYAVESVYALPYKSNEFDVAHVRAMLHHLDTPDLAIKEALRVAPTIVVLEPNGYNLILKIIEQLSPYHREHSEKSFAPNSLDRWVKAAGGKVVARQWIRLVPYFCPDWMVRILRVFEPIVERIPLVNRVACGVYVFVAVRA